MLLLLEKYGVVMMVVRNDELGNEPPLSTLEIPGGLMGSKKDESGVMDVWL